MSIFNGLRACALALVFLTSAATAHAEQKAMLGSFEAHYIIIPTMSITPDIAASYGIVRAKDRSLLNISILDKNGTPQTASVASVATNLLSQGETLDFQEVTEGTAIYYLATFQHNDEEHYRFDVEVGLPNGQTRDFTFNQQVYWELAR